LVGATFPCLELQVFAALDKRWSELMASAQQGDSRAYRELLTEILPVVRAAVRRRQGSLEGVEDVVQDVLLSLHRVRHTYDPSRSFRRWLFAIVHRRAIDRLRSRGRIAKHEDWLSPQIAERAHAADDGEHAHADFGPALVRALNALPASQRQAIDLVKLKELSLSEASAHSGVSVTALKVSVHRGMKTLKQRLGGNVI